MDSMGRESGDPSYGILASKIPSSVSRKILDISRKIMDISRIFDPKNLDIISEHSGDIHFYFLTRISDMSQNSGYIQNLLESLFTG